MEDLHDNIADEEHVDAPQNAPEDAELDEYVQRFEKLGTLTDELTQLKAALVRSTCGDDRIAGLIKCVYKLEQINQEQHALLIEMNNLFGKSE